MATDPIADLLSNNTGLLLLILAALLIALLALFQVGRIRAQHQDRLDSLREKADTLWRELDDIRVAQFHANPVSATTAPAAIGLSEERFRTERAAYEAVWPKVWQLYDKIGLFLRAVESGEPAGELRLEARNLALDARNLLNRNRPFFSAKVEELVSRLIDTEIKAHLAACQYLDLLKDVASHPSDHDRRLMQEKCVSLHENEARDLIGQLIVAIRDRLLAP